MVLWPLETATASAAGATGSCWPLEAASAAGLGFSFSPSPKWQGHTRKEKEE